MFNCTTLSCKIVDLLLDIFHSVNCHHSETTSTTWQMKEESTSSTKTEIWQIHFNAWVGLRVRSHAETMLQSAA